MPLGDSYALLSELQARIATGQTLPSSLDTTLTGCLATASRAVEKACGRQFNDAGSATAREFEPCNYQWVEVDDYSTTSGLVVKFDSAGDGTYATTVAATNYKSYPLNGVVDGESGWPFWRLKAVNYCWPTWWQYPPIQVTARWGWTAVPAGIKEGTLILAEEIYKLRDTPFGTGGYGQFGIIHARKNPNVWLKIGPYAKASAFVPVA